MLIKAASSILSKINEIVFFRKGCDFTFTASPNNWSKCFLCSHPKVFNMVALILSCLPCALDRTQTCRPTEIFLFIAGYCMV